MADFKNIDVAARPAIAHLDVPSSGIVTSAGSPVQGWIAADRIDGDAGLSLVNDIGTVIPLVAVDRPDVRIATPGLRSTGFAGWIDIATAVHGPWRIRYQQDGADAEAPLPLLSNGADALRVAATKARKLQRVRALLRCPVCRAPLDGELPALRCANGHAFGDHTADRYDFLDAELRARVGAVPTGNVSAHGYDAVLLELIAQSEGPIVDVGAGFRPDYREDVVNVEIAPYPTTDVVAASEYLPFADDSFDLAISVAVLEHVRDPFAAARELERIVRPGGRIFAAVPFLQPYHAYPDHYYNMTAAGLRNLFPGCDVERLEVPQSGGPVFTLTWILKAWLAGLPSETARRFAKLRVEELAVEPGTLLHEPFVTELPDAVNVQLAALNVLVGRKRVSA